MLRAPERVASPSTSAPSIVTPVGSLAGLALAALSAAAWGVAGLVITATVLLLVPAVVTDARTGHLPDRLTRRGAVPVAVFVTAGSLPWGWEPALAAAAGAVAMAIPVVCIHLAHPGAMGFGDVKLAAVAGSGVGLADWRLGVLVLAVAAAVTVAVAVVRRRSTMPFGPGLLVGTVGVVALAAGTSLVGTPLLGWETLAWR